MILRIRRMWHGGTSDGALNALNCRTDVRVVLSCSAAVRPKLMSWKSNLVEFMCTVAKKTKQKQRKIPKEFRFLFLWIPCQACEVVAATDVLCFLSRQFKFGIGYPWLNLHRYPNLKLRHIAIISNFNFISRYIQETCAKSSTAELKCLSGYSLVGINIHTSWHVA